MVWVRKNKLQILITLTVVSFVGLTIPGAYYLLNPAQPTNTVSKKVVKPETYGGGGLPQPGSVYQGAPPPIPTQQPPGSKSVLPPPISAGEFPIQPIEPPKPKRLDEEEWYLKTKAVTSIIADIVSGFFPICTAFFSVKIWFRQRRERRLASG